MISRREQRCRGCEVRGVLRGSMPSDWAATSSNSRFAGNLRISHRVRPAGQLSTQWLWKRMGKFMVDGSGLVTGGSRSKKGAEKRVCRVFTKKKRVFEVGKTCLKRVRNVLAGLNGDRALRGVGGRAMAARGWRWTPVADPGRFERPCVEPRQGATPLRVD